MKYKIFTILDSFSNDDMEKFGDFLRSPFFNKNEHLVTLFDWIRNQYHNGRNNTATYASMAASLSSQKINTPPALRKATSQLVVMAEEYLVQIRLHKYPHYAQLFLFKELNKRTIANEARKIMSVKRSSIKRTEESDPSHLFQYLEFLVEENRLNLSSHRYAELINTAQEYSANEEILRMHTRSIGAILHLFAERINGIAPDADMYHEYIAGGPDENKNDEQNPQYLLYRSLLRFFWTNDYASIDSMNRIAVQHHKSIFYGIIDLIYNHLLMYLFYIREPERTHALNDTLLETLKTIGYLNRLKIIPPAVFVTVAELFAEQSDAALLKQYIELNLVKVHPPFQKSLYHLSLGILHQTTGRFSESFSCLSQIAAADPGITISVKIRFIQLCYEMNDDANLTRKCESVRLFVKRHPELPELTGESIKTFRRCIMQLARLRGSGCEEIEQFITSVKNEQMVYNRHWILKKAGEINAEFTLKSRFQENIVLI